MNTDEAKAVAIAEAATRSLTEAFEQTHALIQEAKGVDGPKGGYVTDHLDFAEHWLDKAEQETAALLDRLAERAAGEALEQCVCGQEPRLHISDVPTAGRKYGLCCDNCDTTVGLHYKLSEAVAGWNSYGPKARCPSHIANGICRPSALAKQEPGS